jgi:flagellar basal-body rod modification protein FlgD
MTSVSTLTGQVDTSAAAGNAQSTGTTTATELNDRFLKLLVAQMNNQDPLNPLDNAQVTSQMAQINTVSGINNLNTTVTQLLSQFNTLASMQAAQLTGHNVLVEGNTLSIGAAGGTATGGVSLSTPADTVTVDIKDAAGNTVRELQLGKQDAGVTRFDWDGKLANGDSAPAGSYTISVTAKAGSTAVPATALASRQVTGVTTNNGSVQLVLAGGGSVAYTDIKQIL